MVYGYIRVSTDKQTVENQRHEIMVYAKNNGIKIDSFIEETISGTTKYEKRRLGRLLKLLKEGDILLASELSRLGRSFYMIMGILNKCLNKNIKVITIKEHFVCDDNIESKVIAFAFSLCAEIERQLISQRTKEALYRLKEKGVKLGRPKGRKNNQNIYSKYKEKIYYYLSKGKHISQIAKILKVHPNTLYNYIKQDDVAKSIISKKD